MSFKGFDLEEFLIENVEYKRSGKEILISCLDPDCEDYIEQKFHLSIDPKIHAGRCFKCDRVFKVVDIVMAIEDIDYGRAIKRILHQVAKIPKRDKPLAEIFTAPEAPTTVTRVEHLITEIQLPPSFPMDSPFSLMAKNYLEKRGFGKDVIEHFELSFCKDVNHPFFNRVIIPIRFGPTVVGYQGRDVTGKQDPKYLFPLRFQPGDRFKVNSGPGSGRHGIVEGYHNKWMLRTRYEDGGRELAFHKSGDLTNLSTGPGGNRTDTYANYFYNWDNALQHMRNNGLSFLILVEGVTDCWYLWKNGIRNVVATFGKQLKPEQRRRLLGEELIENVFIFWDGEALKKASALASALSDCKTVYLCQLPPGAEPDGCQNLPEVFRTAIRWNSSTPSQKLMVDMSRL